MGPIMLIYSNRWNQLANVSQEQRVTLVVDVQDNNFSDSCWDNREIGQSCAADDDDDNGGISLTSVITSGQGICLLKFSCNSSIYSPFSCHHGSSYELQQGMCRTCLGSKSGEKVFLHLPLEYRVEWNGIRQKYFQNTIQNTLQYESQLLRNEVEPF